MSVAASKPWAEKVVGLQVLIDAARAAGDAAYADALDDAKGAVFAAWKQELADAAARLELSDKAAAEAGSEG